MLRRRRLLVLGCLMLSLIGGRALAAPPRIDAGGAFDNRLVQDRWQPLVVTLTNPTDGDAINGEVEVALDAVPSGIRLATYVKPVAMPRGPGTERVMVYIRLPDGIAPDIRVTVTDNGQIVTRRVFNKITATPESDLSVLAVSDQVDPLLYLANRDLGVFRLDHALRPSAEFGQNNNVWNNRAAVNRVKPLTEVHPVTPAALPDRALGYDGVGVVYLGDIAPDVLSDGQVDALRAWVSTGGLLVAGGARLASDERIRPLLPARWGAPRPGALRALPGLPVAALTPAGPNRRVLADGVAVQGRFGRGTVIALGFDAAASDVAAWGGAPDLWRTLVSTATAPRALSDAMRAEGMNAWAQRQLVNAVLQAANLRAPSLSVIGLFLVGYLVLLVPLNYAVLKRMDRREWTWTTVPLIVVVFTVGTYLFGYTLKGGDLRLNTSSILDMASGDGSATVLLHAGLFSPRRTGYDLAVESPQALLFQPQSDGNNGQATSEGPLVMAQGNGAVVRDAPISMWSMRVFGVQTMTTLGNGVDVRLSRSGNMLVGTLENRTGRDLNDVVVSTGTGRQNIGRLGTGQKAPVRIVAPQNAPPPTMMRRQRGPNGRIIRVPVAVPMNPSTNGWGIGDSNVWNRPRTTTREAIQSEMLQAIQSLSSSGQGRSAGETRSEVIVAGWNYDTLVPMRVNGGTVSTTDNVNLIVVHAPVP